MSRVNDDNPQAWVIGVDKSEGWHYPSYQLPSKEPDYKKLYEKTLQQRDVALDVLTSIANSRSLPMSGNVRDTMLKLIGMLKK